MINKILNQTQHPHIYIKYYNYGNILIIFVTYVVFLKIYTDRTNKIGTSDVED